MKIKVNGKTKDVRLPKKFKERWVKALRSGKYEQTKSSLYDGKGYCCIGVAGKICGIADDDMFDKGLFSNSSYGFNNKFKTPKLLKGAVNVYYGDYNPVVDKLVTFNDSGKSFKWIASYIEKYL